MAEDMLCYPTVHTTTVCAAYSGRLFLKGDYPTKDHTQAAKPTIAFTLMPVSLVILKSGMPNGLGVRVVISRMFSSFSNSESDSY